MKIDRVIVGVLDTNCYIISKNNKCIVIDPGDEFEKINKVINNKKIVAIIVTHYHFDHIGALKYFDNDLILDRSNLQEKEYNFDDFKFEVIYTPGHKEDSITIYFNEENVMFTGDFIFKGSIGRTDLEGGNIKDIINSLNKISKYDSSIIVYPGHGDKTTLNLNLIY
jgi:glyoxylase-like metal-dependent hydrolase (beta-lactamase superfamily II)